MKRRSGFRGLVAIILAMSLLLALWATALADTATLSPNAVGNFDEWTLGAGADKVAAVSSNDGDTSYIKTSTQDYRQTFAFPGASVPAGSTINSVTLSAVAKKIRETGSGGLGNVQLNLVVEKGTGGSDISDGTSQSIGAGYGTVSRTMTTNPFTGLAWTLSEVNTWAVKFGVRLANTPNTGVVARVTQVSVVVDYTPTYTLTVNIVGSGSVTKNPDQPTYTYGTVVQLTATADPGWTFDSWSGDLSGSTNPDTITTDGDKSVTATFTQDQYTLTVNITGNGSVTKNPDQPTYTYGDVVELTATADPGWSFSAWSGDLSGSTNPDTITTDADKTVTASFAINTYTITVTQGANGTITPGTTTVDYGGSQTFNITPDTGYHIADVVVDGASQGAVSSYDFTNVTADHTITATFTQDQYTLDITIVGNGSVTKDPDQPTYTYNTDVELTATADPGWTFDSWSGDLSGSTNPDTITMDGDKTVTATFTQDEYTLDITIVGNGSVTKDPDQPTYTYNTDVELTATADPGWTFDSWSGDLSGSTNPDTITMDGDKTVTATFTQDQYTLTVNITGNGSVTKDPDQATYTYGTVVQLTATADPGWSFSSWSGDLSGSTNPDTITMDGDKTVTATFTQDQYTLDITIVGNGSVTKDPDQATYTYGTVVTLTATADPGWTFDSWSGDLSDSTNPDTITMDGDKTVTATFTQAQQPVGGGGGGGGAVLHEYFTVDFLGEFTKEPISSTGRLLNSLVASSPDGIHVLEMEKDTLTLSQDGEVIKLIKITEAEPPRLSENIVIVGKVYDFEPSNITFSKPIRLTLGYNINEMPENAISVTLVYYTVESGWVELEAESGVVAEIGKLTASVDHFTIFAVLAGVPPPPLLPPPAPAPAAPAAFELSNLSITPSFSKIWELLTFVVKTGEQVTITVDVTNYGGQEGNYDALLKINGVTQGNQEITLNGGQRQKIVFIVTESKPGSYTVEIGNLSGEFQSLLWFNWLLTGGLTAAFILLGWLAWYYWHYKKGRKTY